MEKFTRLWGCIISKKPQRLLDIRLFQWPWFRQSKTWNEVFSSDKPDIVEKKCLATDKQIKWLNAPGKDLIVETKAKSIIQHPITGEEVWAGFFPIFHLWGLAIEALFVTLYQRTWRSFIVLILLWLVTIIQQFFTYVCNVWNYVFKGQINLPSWFPGNRKSLDVYFEDGTCLSALEIFWIIKAYWKNMTIFNWRNGDILLLDNKRIGHQRLLFKGSARDVCTAFAK